MEMNVIIRQFGTVKIIHVAEKFIRKYTFWKLLHIDWINFARYQNDKCLERKEEKYCKIRKKKKIANQMIHFNMIQGIIENKIVDHYCSRRETSD